MNCLCCSSSAMEKNSSISCAVGICPRIELCTLWLVSSELVGLVAEPGVLILSGSLIKLPGVDSLVPLHRNNGY